MYRIALSTGLLCIAGLAFGQVSLKDHPAIQYTTRPTNDPVAALNERIQRGEVQLRFDTPQNYLLSVLEALNVPIESQVLVFSKTSVQRAAIGPESPRAIFFNDNVAVGAAPRSAMLELASLDPEQGVVFYNLRPAFTGAAPQFRRNDTCLNCHQSAATLRVPGLAVGSVQTEPDGTAVADAPAFISDHRSPLDQRWGGWYVTGKLGAIRHMGKPIPVDGTLHLQFNPQPTSDVAALMVLEHQTQMTNLLIRFGWETRVALHERGKLPPADALVDYMLFVEEAPLAERIESASGFVEKFSAAGPRDSKGRSLRQLDLVRRLMRYACSYMIYSEAFEALPAEGKDAIYRRMWSILSGQEKSGKYARLAAADRQALVEILRDTKQKLPDYFSRELR